MLGRTRFFWKIASSFPALTALATFAGAARAGAPPKGTFFSSTPISVFTAPRPYDVRRADFDGDGNTDFLVSEINQLTIYFMTANRTVRDTIHYAGETLPPSTPTDQLWLGMVDAVGIDAADLTGDGRPEVILIEQPDVRILAVTTTGFQLLASTKAVDYVPLWAAGRFQPGAANQLVLAPPHMAATFALDVMNLSGSSFVPVQMLDSAATIDRGSTGFYGHPMLVADLDGDGRDDLVHPGVDSAVVRLQTAAAGLGAGAQLALGGELETIVAGDFDGDKKIDLAISQVTGMYVKPIHTFTQMAGGGFVESGAPLSMQNAYPSASADLDGDGSAELIGPIVLWRDKEQWTPGETLALGQTGRVYSVEDWDKDGLLDVVILDSVATVSQGELRILRGQKAGVSVVAVSHTSAVAGQPFQAVFEVRNAGPSPSGPIVPTIEATSLYPALIDPPASPSCANPCPLASLDPGQSVRVTIQSKPESNPNERVAITVMGSTWDADLSDNHAEVDVPVDPRADLGGDTSLLADSSSVDMPMSIVNAGPSTASGVHLVVGLPDGISGVSWQSKPQATCSQSGAQLTCDLGQDLANGGQWSLDVRGAFAYDNQRVQVTGDVSSQTTDPVPSNNHFEQVLPAGFLGNLPGGGGLPGASRGCGCGLAAKRTPTTSAFLAALVAAVACVGRRRKTSAPRSGARDPRGES
jgi:hypothetical protein